MLTAQSMTEGPKPTCQGGRVTSKGVKRRDLNHRPRAKRGGSWADVHVLSAGVAMFFGNCADSKYPVYSGRNNAEHRARDEMKHCMWGP